MVDVELSKLYYNPRHPGAFAGLERFYRSQKIATRKQVKEFLKAQETYTLHFPSRVRFPRNQVVVGGINHLWDTDLLSMQNLASENESFKYIVTGIDVLSKYAYCEKLKTKSARDVTAGFRKMLDRAKEENRKPMAVRSDAGSEYRNRSFRHLMEEYGVKHYTTSNTETKAHFAEIFQKFLKRIIFKTLTKRKTRVWIDILEDVVWNYNHSYHRTIKMTPAAVEAGDDTEEIVWRRQYEARAPPRPDGSFKFGEGDLVRLSHVAKVFRREFHQKWTEEVFRVSSRRKRAGLNVYTIQDVEGEDLLGTFYQPELQGVTVDLTGTFDVDHVVRTRKVGRGKKQFLVRWKGYGPKFDSWVDEKDFVPGK